MIKFAQFDKEWVMQEDGMYKIRGHQVALKKKAQDRWHLSINGKDHGHHGSEKSAMRHATKKIYVSKKSS